MFESLLPQHNALDTSFNSSFNNSELNLEPNRIIFPSLQNNSGFSQPQIEIYNSTVSNYFGPYKNFYTIETNNIPSGISLTGNAQNRPLVYPVETYEDALFIPINHDFSSEISLNSNIISRALQEDVYLTLKQFVQSPQLGQLMQSIFGANLNTEKLNSIISQWQAGDFSKLPEIEVREESVFPTNTLGSFAGATEKIYLSQGLINSGNSVRIGDTILEEIGHWLDKQLNIADTPGDEGQMFAAVVRGQNLNENQIAEIRAEDDTTTIFVDGQFLQIEQATIVLPTITIKANDTKAGETLAGQTANPGQFTLTRTGDTASALTVNYTVAGTATNNADYNKLTNSVTFASGASTALINITPIDDGEFEGNETVLVTLSTNTNYKLGTAKTATVNVADNDKPTITISATDTNAGETLTAQPVNPGQFTLTRTGNNASALTVNYTVAGTATNGTDYTKLTNKVIFAAGSSTALINITPIDDVALEDSETVIVSLATNTNYNLGISKNATVNIADNDKPTITISATDANAGETLAGQPTNLGQFTISRTGITTQALTVNYTVQGTATNGTDYDALTGSVVIPVGKNSVALPINVKNDLIAEVNETVVLSLQANNSYALGNESSAIVRIADSNLGGNLKFDGVDDYVNLPPMTFGGAVTVEAWVYVDKHQNWSRIIDLGNGVNNNIVLGWVDSSGKMFWETYQGANTQKLFTNDIFPEKQWVHVAAVNDGKGKGYIYWNGELKASGNVFAPLNVTRNTSYIGRSNWSADAYFNGKMDDVRIWNAARTQPEIKANLNQELNGNEVGLISYWKFNQTTGNIAIDSSAAKQNGEFKNNPILVNPNQWNVSFINRTSSNVADYNSYDFSRPDATLNLGWQNGYDSKPFETLTVDANKNVAPVGQPKVYSSVLEAGKRYRIEVSGQVFYGLSDKNLVVDARFASDNNWSTFNDNFLGLHSTALGGDRVWGDYNTNHVYTCEILGQGQAIDFFFVDTDFANNQGTYTIKLYQELATPPTGNTIRLNANFEERSPAANVQSDNFAMQAWTSTRLDAGKVYQVTTQSDDGTRFFVKNVATGEVTFIGQEWRERSIGEPTWTMYFNVAKSGDYDFYVQGYERGGDSAFNVELKESPNNTKPNHLALVTDFDKDGKNDILWRKYNTGENLAWALDGANKLKELDIEDGTDPAWYVVGTGDFNNDGNVDILWRYHWEQNTGHNVVWLMNGNQHIGSVDLDRVDDNNWHVVGTGDFNQDGNIDILWRNYASGENHIWIMKGMAHETSITLDKQTDLNERIVGTGDFDGDGKIDILWRNAATGKNSIWFLNRINRASIADVQGKSADVNWHVMGTADFNNDGKSDIILRNYANGWNHVWLMNGNTYIGDVDIPDVSELNWNIVGKSDPVPFWTANYFNNRDLSGTSVYQEGLFTLSPSWGLGAPPNVPVDNFSARFTSERYFAPGLYHITTNSDDGVRVWIGNERLIDQWKDQSYPAYSGYFRSTGGYYPVKVEYYEGGGSAALNFKLEGHQAFSDGVDTRHSWNASIFHWNGQGSTPPSNFSDDNGNYIGTVNLGSNTVDGGKKGLNFQNWGAGAPNGDNNRLPYDFFAIRAYTNAYFEAGRTYKAWVRSDDGYQLFAKNHATSQWTFFTPQNEWRFDAYGVWKDVTFSVTQTGWYDFHVQMFEGGGDANFGVWWEDVTPPFNDNPDSSKEWVTSVYKWNGGGTPSANIKDYEANKVGTIKLARRNDGKEGINANWGGGSPNGDSRLPSDNFVISSYTFTYFDGGEYKFRVRGDDGFQLFANGAWGKGGSYNITLANQWVYAYGDYYEVKFTLPAGYYDVGYNMWEGGGDAFVDLSWEKVAPILPPLHSNPTPSNPLRGFRHPLGWGEGTPIIWEHSASFGQKYAVDFGGTFGSSVYAMRSGTVVRWQDTTPDQNPNLQQIDDGKNGVTANYLVVKLDDNDGTDDNYRAMYLHLKQNSIPSKFKQVGARVEAGEYIGNIGYNGYSFGVHLHVEVNYLTGNKTNMWSRETVPFQWA